MNNIYQQAISLVENGAAFRVDFKTRSLVVNGHAFIRDGQHVLPLGIEPCGTLSDVLDKILELYTDYKYSRPSERSGHIRNTYFEALPDGQLSADDFLYSESREVARIKLEAYVLISIINGSLHWNDVMMGTWFYKHPSDSDLIILREWVEP